MEAAAAEAHVIRMADAPCRPMVCIYCVQPSENTKSLAHVFPEAVIANTGVLPRGAVCDDCNNYLGKLDECFVSHPWIALAVQFMGLPGKDGRPRDQLGSVSRTAKPGWVTFDIHPPDIHADEHSSRVASMRPLIDARFDFAQFRRSLHHVAFNVVAALSGPEVMLDSSFDPVRKYIRQPTSRKHAWPFVQHFSGSSGFSAIPTLKSELVNGLHVVTIGFANITFWVDLYGSETLAQIVSSHLPAGADYIPADYRPPRGPKPGRNRYRASIELPPPRQSAPEFRDDTV